jgi:hypothetical protein
LPPAVNFFNRIPQYFNTKHIAKATNKLLRSLQSFVSNSESIYGVVMKEAKVKDTTLIAIKGTSVLYPTVAVIYNNVSILQTFANKNNVEQANPPMLNILKNGQNGYSFMVALPVNKFIEGNGTIVGKRMLPGGNMLESGEVKGGFFTVDNYLKELENFRADISAISPAIPFQSLITDRSKEADTSKWITKLYYPVF